MYAGPLVRTIQTAEPSGQALKLPVQVEAGLIDVDCGQWQGLTVDEVRQRWPAEYQTYLHSPQDFAFPGGESLEAARLRGMDCMQGLIDSHPDQTILVVSHNALNRLILLSILGLGSASYWNIRQDLCALNALEQDNGHFTLITLNETGHVLSLSASQATTGESKSE